MDLSGAGTDSHISVSPREIKTSQFYVADILEKRLHCSRILGPQLQGRNVVVYEVECFPSLEFQGDLALKRYRITRNVRVLYGTE